jgi:hypothetical protein
MTGASTMLFQPNKKPKDMSDQELQDRVEYLDDKLEKTGRIVSALKIGNPVIIMSGVLVLGLFSGFTLATVGAGLVIGVIGMASARATTESLSASLERSRGREKNKLLEEEWRRMTDMQEQQRLDRENAPQRKELLERSIEKDFNEGLARPVAAGRVLSLKKKRGFIGLFTTT